MNESVTHIGPNFWDLDQLIIIYHPRWKEKKKTQENML